MKEIDIEQNTENKENYGNGHYVENRRSRDALRHEDISFDTIIKIRKNYSENGKNYQRKQLIKIYGLVSTSSLKPVIKNALHYYPPVQADVDGGASQMSTL